MAVIHILIENVPQFLKMLFADENSSFVCLPELLGRKYGERYHIQYGIYDAADYEVPQRRKRAIIQMYKKGLLWGIPEKCSRRITVREAIGHLPSIEGNTKQADVRYPYHNGSAINYQHIEMLKHTPTGHSAFENHFWNPKNGKTGYRIKGYKDTYRRIAWDDVCPTITMHSGNVSWSNTVHPRHHIAGDINHENSRIFSDARPLSILEIMLLTSLLKDMS